MPTKSKFSGLLAAPDPLPDDSQDQAPADVVELDQGQANGQAASSPARERSPRPKAAASAPSTSPEPGGEAIAEPTPTQPVGVPASRRAATTIRLHGPDATELDAEWLNQRSTVDPTLSKPEFAGVIFRLGLAAFREGKRA